MWDKVVSLAGEKVLPLVWELVNVIKGAPKEVAEIKEELERIQAIINSADRMVAVDQDNTRTDEVKRKVKKLRETTFLIEDVVEDYMITEEQQPRDPGCASSPCVAADFIKTMILRLRISYEIQGIKSRVAEIEPDHEQQGSSSSCAVSQNVQHSLRKIADYAREEDVVGFKAPRDELIRWVEETQARRTVISVVGMGGRGKTTLAKTVYDKVKGKFDCYAWITVSQDYTVEGVLRGTLNQFYKAIDETPPEAISTMNGSLLTDEVRNYLKQKRYVIMFDDVWDINFWNEIQLALLDDEKGSRILITTRSKEVAESCKAFSLVYIQNLQPLSPSESLELFCKKAFLNEPDGLCPEELEDISSKIVEKCDGLPLAIVAIGSLLATKEKNSSEWQRSCQTLLSPLEKNPKSFGIKNILGLSYDNLSIHLKPCFLYFGIYPEDYEVESKTVIKQWIAEGFVKHDEDKTLEEVAEEYLKELISRSLVQVSSFNIDGKIKTCQVHDLLHEIILTTIKDLSFCHIVKDDKTSMFSGMIRRLKISTNSQNLMVNIEGSHIWTLHIFMEDERFCDNFVRIIPTEYKLLKVLAFDNSSLHHVPENLGNLLRLRYLSFRSTDIRSLPNSIGDLQFLETLDIRDTWVHQMPREINKLTKLRHLLVDPVVEMTGGVGGLVSLQTLCVVNTDFNGEELIKELRKLRELRLLHLVYVKSEYVSNLCLSINEMKHLENLYIGNLSCLDISPLCYLDSPLFDSLRKLGLSGMLERLPDCIPNLKNLVRLFLEDSGLTDDPLESLKDMPHLLHLSLNGAYEGESLHFPDGGFKKLQKLSLLYMNRLNSILIGKKALPSLKELEFDYLPKLTEVPNGIDQLEKLEVLHVIRMPEEFQESIRKDDRINKHVHQVNISQYRSRRK